jgi:hypothetical protein
MNSGGWPSLAEQPVALNAGRAKSLPHEAINAFRNAYEIRVSKVKLFGEVPSKLWRKQSYSELNKLTYNNCFVFFCD